MGNANSDFRREYFIQLLEYRMSQGDKPDCGCVAIESLTPGGKQDLVNKMVSGEYHEILNGAKMHTKYGKYGKIE